MSKLGTQLRLAATFLFVTLGALVMLLVAVPTLFIARRFYSEVMARWLGEMALRIWGVRYRVHGEPQPADVQTIYVSNHTSTLDLFVLIALALPRTRFFLSGFLKTLPPIGIVGTLIRIFWTVPQEYPEKRVAIFKRADRILRATGDSVYLSPEGMRITSGEIGHFNKGSFHLATSLHAQIVPIYFSIPREINPGMGYDAKPGLIDVYFLPPIDTSRWAIGDLERNRDAVRDLFVRVHDAMRATGRLPESLAIEADAPLPAVLV
ncbi:MAG TPA: lysophospholipid acyltransferase family protein [Gemmatimonadaceae bacterium]|jgi:1-acyl-sn-glycerol-3-phosphate acyltransferase|nr:lysophospholipid acyltransferase family protein [Gemmatimonadaceae bacterium]